MGFHFGARAGRHSGPLFGILEQLQHAVRELRGTVGQEAELALPARQPFGADGGGDRRDSRRESLQQLHAHARSAENRADEYGVAREWLAHVFHVSEDLDAALQASQAASRRRIGPDHGQARLRLPREDERHGPAEKPIERRAIRSMPEAAQEEHGQRLAAARAEAVARGVDSRAQTGAHLRREPGKKGEQVLAVGGSADLHPVALGKRAQLIAQRAQVLEPRLQPVELAEGAAQAAGHRLEVDVVLEKRDGDAAVRAAILGHGRVFELQHVDALAVKLAVDHPIQVVNGDFPHGVGQAGPGVDGLGGGAHEAFRGGAETAQFLIVPCLRGPIQQGDHVGFRELRQLAQRLVHEHGAAVYRRGDGIGRNEEHAQPLGIAFHGREAVSVVAAERAPEGLRIAHGGQAASAPTRARRLRQLPERAPERRRIRPQRNVAEYCGQRGPRPREEEVRGEAPPLVDVLPAEQQVVLLQHGFNPVAAKALADGAAVLVIHHAARLVEHLPAALPCHIAEVGVF